MAHTLDGSSVAIGDNVYGVGHGPGQVIELLTEDRFRVQFAAGSTYTFGSDGVMARAQYRSLFWRDPVLAAPGKDETRWNRIVPIITAAMGVFDEVA